MDELKGRYIIKQLQKKWANRLLLANIVSLLAICLFITLIAVKGFHTSWFLFPILLIISFVFLFFFFYKRITEHDVSRFLNKALPELQESTGLLLKPSEDLNFFEKLQIHKIDQVLDEHIRQPKTINKKLTTSFIFLLLSLLALVVSYLLPANFTLTKQQIAIQQIKETKLPQVDEVTIKITPPAYTGRETREQDKFNVAVEESGIINWHITTTMEVNDLALIFNDSSVVQLTPLNKAHTQWSTNKQIKSPGFYQVKIGANQSELYKIEMIKDEVPVIVIQSPKPNTVIEPGQSPKSLLNVSITDDYGIQNAFVYATIASGSGEAVKFKTQQLPFNNFTAGNNKYQLQKQLDLPALGMKAGDELYFYVSATDTYNQEKRSDIYIIRIEDTVQLMSMVGLASGIDIKPEFFRSERQIIIETEQLLREKDTISAEQFKTRSNDLGIDQKLLRLRYGKFLGGESDAEEHDHKEDNQNDAADFGNAQKMIDEVSHKHDNAEDATFFDAQTKKQLKATLDEMWKAELQLRTYLPKDALPFEYKALKLLKELQQQTRAFVSKTGSKTTPLKPEKRLTGELDKIIQPVQQQTFEQKADETVLLRKALGVLEQIRNKEPVQPSSTSILEQAEMQLSNKAAAEPAAYLSSLEALRRIVKNHYTDNDISVTGKALQKIINTISRIPQQPEAGTDMKLSQQYFINLNHKNE
jgi:hypothetical protein